MKCYDYVIIVMCYNFIEIIDAYLLQMFNMAKMV